MSFWRIYATSKRNRAEISGHWGGVVVMHRWVGAGRFSCFELSSFSVKLELELQCPVLLG